MATNASLAVIHESAVSLQPHRTAVALAAQRTAIVECMQKAMRPEIDYGKIPGTDKPTLFKPGSEKLLSMFNLAAEPIVEDLSTPDCIRYRVAVRVTEIASGRYLGQGVGEASSAESKYQWRAAVCTEEFEGTPEDRRRIKWNKGYRGDPPYQVRQVRAEMEDVANTVLKMAKKRAQIDAVLTITAASDVFSQDLEDLPPGMAADVEPGTDAPASELPDTLQRKQPSSQPAAQQQRTAPAQSGGRVISEAQARRFYAIGKNSGRTDQEIKDKLQEKAGNPDSRQMPSQHYDKAVAWLQGAQW